ncbi:mandelate racemase/muconate lactonizing enzyme family protein [Shumkonia mesophila]|uniref:mandelate racemase/muconate lactonizing enzyme family protein n=1 Tax=Shumkonia mesophila TaxID=2838854 RepID=UPI0029352B46|nr:mandelate racemase/muconate lactonizing enzyme family protein [Shumkonia mesophila]
MRIVDIREKTGTLATTMRNAFIDFSQMTVSLVAVVTDVIRDGHPVVGYGFNANGRYAQGGILRERLIPRILKADPKTLLDADGANIDPFKVFAAMMTNEKPGGHGDRAVAVAALDMAVWDATAKIAGVPLWKLLAERFNKGQADDKVLVYPGGGYYYPDGNMQKLKDEMQSYLDDGYTVVKMKIGAADLATDIARIEAVIEVVGEGSRLAVDANGKFDLETALAYGKAMTPYGLFWYEEAGDPLDYALQAKLAKHYSGPFATGENLFSHQDIRNLLRYGALDPKKDWIMPDPALAMGLTEGLRIIEAAEKEGWPRRRIVLHGGTQLALSMAAGLQLGGTETYPLMFQPYGGFADGVPVDAGYVALPDAPGLGIEMKAKLFAVMKTLAD